MTGTVWPLRASPNKRYLVDAYGVPFPILGRTAWDVVSISFSDQRLFIQDCLTRGYNCIEFGMLWHDQATSPQAPLDGAGNPPFTNRLDGGTYTGSVTYSNPNNEAPDLTLPNSSYWANLDQLINYCSTMGVLCMVFPAYVGFSANHWMVEKSANGATKTQTYGAFVANRYKGYGNLVWMIGGDRGTGSNPFGGGEVAIEQAMINGLKSVSGQSSTFVSAEWNTESIFDDGSGQFTLTGGSVVYQPVQGAYSFTGDVANQARRGWSANNGPTYLLEEPFDEEGPDGNSKNAAATQPVRRYQWWGFTSGIAGYNSGNGYIWPFNSSGTLPATDNWKSHLATQGAKDQRRMNDFIRSVQWWRLIPSGLSGMRALIASGGSSVSASDYVSAACADNGSFMLAYLPPAHGGAIGLDMRAMSATSRARWFDPTAGTFTTNASAAGTFTLANTATSQSFTAPATNSAGDADWILVIDIASNPVGPGTVFCA